MGAIAAIAVKTMPQIVLLAKMLLGAALLKEVGSAGLSGEGVGLLRVLEEVIALTLKLNTVNLYRDGKRHCDQTLSTSVISVRKTQLQPQFPCLKLHCRIVLGQVLQRSTALTVEIRLTSRWTFAFCDQTHGLYVLQLHRLLIVVIKIRFTSSLSLRQTLLRPYIQCLRNSAKSK